MRLPMHLLAATSLALLAPQALAWGPYSHWAIGLEAQARAGRGDLDETAFMAGLCAPDVFASLEAQAAAPLDAMVRLFGAPQVPEVAKFAQWATIGANEFHGPRGRTTGHPGCGESDDPASP